MVTYYIKKLLDSAVTMGLWHLQGYQTNNFKFLLTRQKAKKRNIVLDFTVLEQCQHFLRVAVNSFMYMHVVNKPQDYENGDSTIWCKTHKSNTH